MFCQTARLLLQAPLESMSKFPPHSSGDFVVPLLLWVSLAYACLMGIKETSIGNQRGRYSRRMEIRSCTGPKCTELFEAAIGRQAAYCSVACKLQAYRYRKWDREQRVKENLPA